MKKNIIILFISLAPLLSAQGQLYSDSVKNALVNIYSQLLVYPQEKVYVQTDRPYYLSGEKIFFRAFLLNASTHRQSSFSRYLYVELVSPVDSVVIRKQIRIDENKMFYGALPLTESLPEGDYRIRCYTRYMENMGESAFFTHSIYIVNPNSASIEIDPQVDFSRQGQVAISLQVKDEKTKEKRYPHEIVCSLGNSQQKTITKADLESGKSKKFNLKDNDSQRTLLVEYHDDRNSFSKYIQLPYHDIQPEINFFPEGGNLIAGQDNRIAFKALLPGGKAVGIKGSIFNSRNEQLATFYTRFDGMGVFTLKTLAGESYHARCEYKDQTFEVKLPEVKSNGYSLSAFWERDSLTVSVRYPGTIPAAQCYLLVQRQGVPTYMKTWNFSKNNIKLNRDKFATGVTHLMLLTGDFRPVSERMVFNNLNDQAGVEILSPEIKSKPGEHITLDIHLTDKTADSIPASFAISVTDDKDVKIDTTTNILSEILLTSELEGHINNPAWYFSNSKEAPEAADLLMLTHGWRRYFVPEALQGKIQHPVLKPEVTQSFSGLLKKPTGKPYKQGMIKMSAIGYDFSDAVKSDDQGRYQFTGFEFPDSTAYFFLAATNENTTDIEISPDKINYPTLTIPWSKDSEVVEENSGPVSYDFVIKADRKYRQENGMRLIDLPEVSVKARKIEPKSKPLNNFVGPGIIPDRTVSMDNIKEIPPVTLEELLWRIPGVNSVSVNSGTSTDICAPSVRVGIRGGIGLFVVNGVPTDHVESAINVREIAQVDVYMEPNVTLLYTSRGCISAVIAITTWPPGSSNSVAEITNTKHILPLGYQKPVEFYSPKYDTPEALNNKNPDLRTTIYWKPNVTIDTTQKASVDFYAADASSTTYSVVIEGVGPGRKLMYRIKRAFIKVDNK